MTTYRVRCLGCGRDMRRDRGVAVAYHTRVAPTIHLRFVCDTPDCGNELVVEADEEGDGGFSA